MNKKIISRIFVCLLTMLVLFFLSYKITVKIRTTAYKQTETSQTGAVDTASKETQTEEITSSEAPVAEAISSSVYSSLTALPEPIIVNMPTDNTWSLVVLNVFYRMNSDYEPQVEAIEQDSDMFLEKRVAEKFREMSNAALADGISLNVVAAYVSLERQARKFTKQVNEYVANGYSQDAAQLKASYSVLPSGQNEANYGLTVDIGWQSEDFRDSPAYNWLKNNAANYGFIERYPEDKIAYTCFTPEPWHWRYVGVDYALEMTQKNQCLEEYAGKVN